MLKWIIHELKEAKTLLAYGSVKIGGHISDFLVPVILATQFSPGTFGAYSLGMMIVYFFNSALILSSSKPAVVFGNEEFKERGRIHHTMASRMIILSIALAAFIILVYLFRRQAVQFTGLTESQVWLLVLVLLGYSILNFFSSMLMALNQRILESVFLLLNAGVSILYLFVIYLFFDVTIEKVLVMFFVAPVISVCLFLPKLEFKEVHPPAFDKENLIKMADFTKWMVFGGAGIYLLNWGDNIILRRFVTMEDIGVYNLGYQFFKGTLMSIAIVKLYFLPFISQHIDNEEKIFTYLTIKRGKIFLLGLLILIGLFFGMQHILGLLYSPHYRGAATVFQILTFASICSLYTGFYDPIIDSMKRYQFIQLLTLAGVVLNLSLDYLLIGRIGYIGAAVATAITYFFLALAREIYFRRNFKISMSD
ncbi:MAG: polysaccharide biosynthesis C-terminal domain-containing protein [Desulfobacterales bacterium]|jgi:O-antigen/teichoic acid export membrane protein|nr:polysaccharide biosynthesis C-terminal domain-containing protein [Desulfobacterales bacterium]